METVSSKAFRWAYSSIEAIIRCYEQPSQSTLSTQTFFARAMAVKLTQAARSAWGMKIGTNGSFVDQFCISVASNLFKVYFAIHKIIYDPRIISDNIKDARINIWYVVLPPPPSELVGILFKTFFVIIMSWSWILKSIIWQRGCAISKTPTEWLRIRVWAQQNQQDSVARLKPSALPELTSRIILTNVHRILKSANLFSNSLEKKLFARHDFNWSDLFVCYKG